MKEYLKYLNSFNRISCPKEHYPARKIFILNTDEYNIDEMCNEFRQSYSKWAKSQSNYITPNIEMRNVNKSDYPFLYKLLKERPPEANISHKTMPSFEDHVKFCDSKPYLKWMIVEKNVGAIYLTKDYEIGIAIAKEYRGRGYSEKCLRSIIDSNKGNALLANISPKNKISQKLFEKIGFKLIQFTYELETYNGGSVTPRNN